MTPSAAASATTSWSASASWSTRTSDDGIDFDECVRLARLFEAEGHLDFFNAIFGRMDTDIALAEHNMPGMSQPLTPFLATVGAFKQETRLPVFHAARIPDIASARHAIAEGLLDMVAMTRAHMADPQIVNKLMRGEEERIRPCVGASYCMYKKTNCIHNPATGREQTMPQVIPRSAAPRRRIVVVGGGPAGLEAARVAPSAATRGAVRGRGQAGRPAAARDPRHLAPRPHRHRRLARRRAGPAGVESGSTPTPPTRRPASSPTR